MFIIFYPCCLDLSQTGWFIPCESSFQNHVILGFSIFRHTHLRAPGPSHIMREKSHHPHGTAAIQKVTSGSGKSHQGRRITRAQPVSSIIRDLVKSSRSIAHSDDIEGHKLIQTYSRQLFLLDLNILYWCPASRDHHQTPSGTASNFFQCKWVSCSKSYWQGYDLAWYKDMEAPCFPQPNLWLARCASRSWAALRKFVVEAFFWEYWINIGTRQKLLLEILWLEHGGWPILYHNIAGFFNH